MYSTEAVGLVLVDAVHVRVVCDSCRTATAEVCAKRALAIEARLQAVPKFRAVGWHHDAGFEGRTRAIEQAQRVGSGRWYCPTCARQTHL